MTRNRRDALASLGTLAAAPFVLAAAPPSAAPAAPAAGPEALTPKSLPFDAKKLRGLSEKLLTSHHDNNTWPSLLSTPGIRPQVGDLPVNKAS
jgi:Fe-Mn family superoxide dismutase